MISRSKDRYKQSRKLMDIRVDYMYAYIHTYMHIICYLYVCIYIYINNAQIIHINMCWGGKILGTLLTFDIVHRVATSRLKLITSRLLG